MTLYRAGGDSPIARSLIRAAERGVQVAVLVELKARFDEATNVGWAKGARACRACTSCTAWSGLKTHAKCVLVVRHDDDGLRRYCHIGTGNYNSKTARLYEDVGFLTCDPAVGADVTQLFNHLTGYSRAIEFQSLLVAPRDLRTQLIDLIEHEMSFGDRGPHHRQAQLARRPGMIEALYRASQPGVQVDLITRGICCLRPGVPGLSENIRVRSILGRYLEHSRIVRFEHGENDAAAVPHRQRRLDGPQPRPSHRGAGAGRAPEAPRLARPGARVRSGRRHRAPRARRRRRVAPPWSGRLRRSATPRSACTAG